MRRLVLVALALVVASCEDVRGFRVKVEITEVPSSTTSLRAVIVLGERETTRTWRSDELTAIQNGRTELTVGLSENDRGALVVRVEARVESCLVAQNEARCDAVSSCGTLRVALPQPTACTVTPPGDDDDAGVSVEGDAAMPEMPDAAVPDAAPAVDGDPLPAFNGVHCGAATCGLGARHCCEPGKSGAYCSADPSCEGRPSLACDGPEDCAGALCCGDGEGAACGASCGGKVTVCGEASDCPPEKAKCCPWMFGVGRCLANCP